MSNRPATWRTARCSSRIDVYCCGSSQPPKATMRPPTATWPSQTAGRCGALAVKSGALIAVEVDGFRVDELEHLLVVASPRFCHHLRDIARPLRGPLKLFRELVLRRLAVKLQPHCHLGALVIGRGCDEQLGVAHGSRVNFHRRVQLCIDLPFGEAGEVALTALHVGAHRLDESDRSLLDKVWHRQALFAARFREPDDKIEVRGDQALLASHVAERGLVEQPILLGAAERFGRAGFPNYVVQRGGIAVDKLGSPRVVTLTVAGAHRLRFYVPAGSGLRRGSRRECSTFYIGSASPGLPYSETCADGRR